LESIFLRIIKFILTDILRCLPVFIKEKKKEKKKEKEKEEKKLKVGTLVAPITNYNSSPTAPATILPAPAAHGKYLFCHQLH